MHNLPAKGDTMRHLLLLLLGFLLLGGIRAAVAGTPEALIRAPIDESDRVTLGGNTPPSATLGARDQGAVEDAMRFQHVLLMLKRDAATEATLERHIVALHTPGSTEFHRWLTAEQVGAQFGANPQDVAILEQWLTSHGFTVNRLYKSGLILDISGTAAQIRETFHTEIHNLRMPGGERHLANVADPQIPAALASAVVGVSLHDFFARPRLTQMRPVRYDQAARQWKPQFTLPFQGSDFFVVAPFDFATIYNLLPLWRAGITGKGVTIATVEDSNLKHPGDWSTFRKTFGLEDFELATFQQVYPACPNPGQNGDEIEAALDVEWASAAAPDAHIVLSACGNTATTSGLDLAILNLLETSPPDIISDSYGLCETITGQTEIALENFEAQLASLEGVTFFIAQGDTGADECAPVEVTNYSTLGINSGDNTASAFAVDVGGTDFMAQYNADTGGLPVSTYWSANNTPKTLASALSYIPEIPWNDGCTSRLIYSDPMIATGFTQSFGPGGFCNSANGQKNFLLDIGGSGGPSTCFTGTPSIPGVVSGTCKGNPKPVYQYLVPGMPDDGLRDQPDVSLFAGNGIWGSFYVECLSDKQQGGTTCTPSNDAIFLGGGGTSFASPAMAGILALIEQRHGRQGDANFVLYALAAEQFRSPQSRACNASRTDGRLPASSCVFNDITAGDMDIPCGQNSDGNFYDCHGASASLIGELSTSDSRNEPAYPAGAGYDLATGLGSVNATNLFDAWPD
jgi:subtilase family serine protease